MSECRETQQVQKSFNGDGCTVQHHAKNHGNKYTLRLVLFVGIDFRNSMIWMVLNLAI